MSPNTIGCLRCYVETTTSIWISASTQASSITGRPGFRRVFSARSFQPPRPPNPSSPVISSRLALERRLPRCELCQGNRAEVLIPERLWAIQRWRGLGPKCGIHDRRGFSNHRNRSEYAHGAAGDFLLRSDAQRRHEQQMWVAAEPICTPETS
jgi:hypothetical protein